MSDKPILFSAPMVLSLLDGRKTQTRRVLKPKTEAPVSEYTEQRPNPSGLGVICELPKDKLHVPIFIDDRLWVRETAAFVGSLDPQFILYRASGYEAECARHEFDKPYPAETGVKWKPSIFMPRWASRITLTVTDVRVECLQDISRGDAMDEGCPFPNMANGPDPRHWYSELWNSINGDGAWEKNPWVAAYSFTVHLGNIDEVAS